VDKTKCLTAAIQCIVPERNNDICLKPDSCVRDQGIGCVTQVLPPNDCTQVAASKCNYSEQECRCRGVGPVDDGLIGAERNKTCLRFDDTIRRAIVNGQNSICRCILIGLGVHRGLVVFDFPGSCSFVRAIVHSPVESCTVCGSTIRESTRGNDQYCLGSQTSQTRERQGLVSC
jgi:hypothetical protein